MLAQQRATCLLLDEPTNHLDIESLEVLEGWKTGPAHSSWQRTTAAFVAACDSTASIDSERADTRCYA